MVLGFYSPSMFVNPAKLIGSCLVCFPNAVVSSQSVILIGGFGFDMPPQSLYHTVGKSLPGYDEYKSYFEKIKTYGL